MPRASQDAARQRRSAPVQLILARTVLPAAIFGIAATIGLDGIAAPRAGLMLGIVGAVYLVSRRVYLPVPHLECFRLLPGARQWPQALKPGLTPPACTLPLVAVVGVLAAPGQRIDIALGAGRLFGTLFLLPTVWDSLHGLSAAYRVFLNRAANASLQVTAALLWDGATLIWQRGI